MSGVPAAAAFVRALGRHARVVLDGGLATRLEARGHELGTKLWSAELPRSAAEAIVRARSTARRLPRGSGPHRGDARGAVISAR